MLVVDLRGFTALELGLEVLGALSEPPDLLSEGLDPWSVGRL